jgi:hypothetical protein
VRLPRSLDELLHIQHEDTPAGIVLALRRLLETLYGLALTFCVTGLVFIVNDLWNGIFNGGDMFNAHTWILTLIAVGATVLIGRANRLAHRLPF